MFSQIGLFGSWFWFDVVPACLPHTHDIRVQSAHTDNFERQEQVRLLNNLRMSRGVSAHGYSDS